MNRACLVLAGLLLCACGGGGNGTNDASDDGNTSLDSGEGDGSNGDGSNGDGSTGDGGMMMLEAHGGLTLAAAGTVCSSSNYKMIVTLGQSPGGNVTSSSMNFRLNGGVVGATQ